MHREERSLSTPQTAPAQQPDSPSPAGIAPTHGCTCTRQRQGLGDPPPSTALLLSGTRAWFSPAKPHSAQQTTDATGGITYRGQQASLSSDVDMIVLLTLRAGAGDLSQLLVQRQLLASTSLLHPPPPVPGARRGCLCLHLEAERRTAERDGTSDRTGGCCQG